MKTTITLITSALLLSFSAANAGAAKTKSYPKDVCIVSDNKLGSMGRPITKVHGDQEVKFCCKPCVAKFEKNPDKYLGKL